MSKLLDDKKYFDNSLERVLEIIKEISE